MYKFDIFYQFHNTSGLGSKSAKGHFLQILPLFQTGSFLNYSIKLRDSLLGSQAAIKVKTCFSSRGPFVYVLRHSYVLSVKVLWQRV